MTAFEDISSLVTVDEVGIHAARAGPFVLKTTFTPVYCPDGEELRIAALIGGARFHLAGKTVGAAAVEQLPAEERSRAVELGRVLVALNRINTGMDGIPVIMPSGSSEEMNSGTMGAVLDASQAPLGFTDFEPARLICELPSPEQAGLESLARHAAECRRREIGVALRGFAGSQAAIEAVRAIRPEIVSLDARWFRHVATMAQAARLLPILFRGLRTAGATVHVGGLDGVAQAAAAVAAGAGLLSGTALAEPLLAGTVLRPVSIPVEDLRQPEDNVVPLFG